MALSNKESFWWLRGKFYSLYIDAFAGDIPGLIDRLDYFTALGIDCLHILPHYPSPMRDGGYDIIDHTGVRPELGSVKDFTRLCAEAHKRGLRIMVDLVLNHVSTDHEWFQEAKQNKVNAKRDYFLWSETGAEYANAATIFPDFKKSNWIYNEATNDYYYATFKPSQPDLNWQNDAVLHEMFGVIDALVEQGVDGFRLDAIMNLVERDGTTSLGLPETHARIREVRSYLDTNYPGIILLGEIVATTNDSRAYFGNSDECHLSYNFELMNEMFYALLCGGRRERLKVAVEAAKALPPQASWMAFLRNHDSVNIQFLGTERSQKLLRIMDPDGVYAFSNGQETVQRLWDLLQGDESLVREAFAMMYALPSASVLYYGDEIGQRNALLPPGEDDRRAVVRGVFDWEEAQRQMSDPNSLWSYVRSCLRPDQD